MQGKTYSNHFIISSLKQKHALAQAGASRAQATPKQIWDHVGGQSWRVFFSAVEQGKCTLCNSGEHLGGHSCGTPHFGNVLSLSSLACVLQALASKKVTNIWAQAWRKLGASNFSVGGHLVSSGSDLVRKWTVLNPFAAPASTHAPQLHKV